MTLDDGEVFAVLIQERNLNLTTVIWSFHVHFNGVVDFLDLGGVKSDALLAVEVKLAVLPCDILFKLVTIN